MRVKLAAAQALHAVHTEILQISKQLHNLTRIHAQGYIEETVYQERRIRIEQQLAEKKKCLTCQKQNGTAEKALYQTKQIDRYMQNHTALTEFDEEAIAQYESGFRTPKESRTKDIAKALNVREENFFTRAETPEDIIRLMIWYDWEHGCGGSVPIDTILLFDNFEEVEKLLKEWYSQKEKLRARTITRAKYLEWMLH